MKHRQVLKLRTKTQFGLRCEMDPWETLGLESLGIEKHKPSEEKVTRKAKTKVKLKECGHDQIKVGRVPHQFSRSEKILTTSAVPSYQSLPITPVGSSASHLDPRSRPNIHLIPYCGAANAPRHQPLKSNVFDSNPQTISGYQSTHDFPANMRSSSRTRLPEEPTPQNVIAEVAGTSAVTVMRNKPDKSNTVQKSNLSVVAITELRECTLTGIVGTRRLTIPRNIFPMIVAAGYVHRHGFSQRPYLEDRNFPIRQQSSRKPLTPTAS